MTDQASGTTTYGATTTTTTTRVVDHGADVHSVEVEEEEFHDVHSSLTLLQFDEPPPPPPPPPTPQPQAQEQRSFTKSNNNDDEEYNTIHYRGYGATSSSVPPMIVGETRMRTTVDDVLLSFPRHVVGGGDPVVSPTPPPVPTPTPTPPSPFVPPTPHNSTRFGEVPARESTPNDYVDGIVHHHVHRRSVWDERDDDDVDVDVVDLDDEDEDDEKDASVLVVVDDEDDEHRLSLRRTFCLGAVDGVLTGSSVTFAAVGLGVFDPFAPLGNRLLFVALTSAACAADGLCMAIGHVRQQQQAAAASSSSAASRSFGGRGSGSVSVSGGGPVGGVVVTEGVKARLVDELTARGMIRVDAESVADALEGYPDVFASVLSGDGASAVGGGRRRRPLRDVVDDDATDRERRRRDRAEGASMMTAFALFSVAAPLAHSFAPRLFAGTTATTTATTFRDDDDYERATTTGVASPTTVTATVLSLVMIVLGAWKSKFCDGNWIVHSVETVMILAACNVSAYLLGALFRHVLFGGDGPTTLTFTVVSS